MGGTTARLLLLLTAVLFSTGGAAIKALSLTGWQRASFRSGIAAVFLFLVLRQARRWPRWPTLLVGVGYAATMVTFVLANTYASAATAVFTQALAPLFVMLLAPWLLREPRRPRDLAFMAALAVGYAFLLAAPEAASRVATDPRLGLVCASASCIGWAATLLGMRWLARAGTGASDPAPQALVLGNALACVGTLPLALPVAAWTPSDLAWLAYLGVFQIGVAYVCLARGLRQVSALEASLLLMLEPVLNPVWTLLLHGEVPHALTWTGGAVVMCGTVLHTIAGARAASRRSQPGERPALEAP
jgi:drug/metabolite transporter (DMT)-like permease